MEKILLVRYKETGDYEGFIRNKKEFREWLKENNKRRKEEGELIEKEHEFEFIEIEGLK